MVSPNQIVATRDERMLIMIPMITAKPKRVSHQCVGRLREPEYTEGKILSKMRTRQTTVIRNVIPVMRSL